MRKVSLAATATAVCVGTIPATDAAAVQKDQVFRYGGARCVEPGVIVPVPVERVRPYLPAGFEPASTTGADTGLAEVTIAVADCEQTTVGRARRGRGAISDVGVLVKGPEGEGGTHYYELWQLGSVAAQRQRVKRAGVRGAHVRGLEASFDEGLVARSSGKAPWSAGSYAIDVTAGAPFGSDTLENSWWHEGTAGRIRMDFSFSGLSLVLGEGRVTTDRGSPLAAIIGGTSAEGVGFIARFDYSTVVRTARPARVGALRTR